MADDTTAPEDSGSEESKVIPLVPDKLGKIQITLDIDANKYHIAMENMQTAQLMKPEELNLLVNPFMMTCLYNELRSRAKAKSGIVGVPDTKLIITLKDEIDRRKPR
jgi:hypothetical protein